MDNHTPTAAELWPVINKLRHIVATCCDAPCTNCGASTVKCPTWDNPEWSEAVATLEAIAERLPS